MLISETQAVGPRAPGQGIPFHPLIADWFAGRFLAPTDAQTRAWPVLHEGRDALISAPTGSGKTLAAFLVCLDRLVRAAATHDLDDRVEVVYVSPLKALSNDVQKNFEAPLAEITALAFERGQTLAPIRTAPCGRATRPRGNASRSCASRRTFLSRPRSRCSSS